MFTSHRLWYVLHLNWNAGILEKWVMRLARIVCCSERILDGWVNGNNRFGDKIKNGYYLLKYHYSIIPLFRNSIQLQKKSR